MLMTMTMFETQLLAPETGSNRNCGGANCKTYSLIELYNFVYTIDL